MATDASSLYARNLFNFISPMLSADGSLQINREDEVIDAALLCSNGEFLKPDLIKGGES